MKLLPYSEEAAALLKMGLIVDVSGTEYLIKQKNRYNTIKQHKVKVKIMLFKTICPDDSDASG